MSPRGARAFLPAVGTVLRAGMSAHRPRPRLQASVGSCEFLTATASPSTGPEVCRTSASRLVGPRAIPHSVPPAAASPGGAALFGGIARRRPTIAAVWPRAARGSCQESRKKPGSVAHAPHDEGCMRTPRFNLGRLQLWRPRKCQKSSHDSFGNSKRALSQSASARCCSGESRSMAVSISATVLMWATMDHPAPTARLSLTPSARPTAWYGATSRSESPWGRSS